MGFSRQEYWSGLPCSSPGDLPHPGIEPTSLLSPALEGRFFTTSTTWEALSSLTWLLHLKQTLHTFPQTMLVNTTFFFFNWRLITLQYCGGFCHTFTWISHGCTCVSHPDPPSPFHPSGSSQCTRPEHPALCIEPGLVIYFTYDNIHVSMLYFQIIPPWPSPRVQQSVLYICVSFIVSHIGSSLPSF